MTLIRFQIKPWFLIAQIQLSQFQKWPIDSLKVTIGNKQLIVFARMKCPSESEIPQWKVKFIFHGQRVFTFK
jgi:hypothetical protein